jgi:hypothetical protein
MQQVAQVSEASFELGRIVVKPTHEQDSLCFASIKGNARLPLFVRKELSVHRHFNAVALWIFHFFNV